MVITSQSNPGGLTTRKFLLVGMPASMVTMPPYSLVYVSSIINSAGWEITILDVNIKLYHRLMEEDRLFWRDGAQWPYQEKKVEALFFKYRERIKEVYSEVLGPVAFDMVGFTLTEQNRLFTLLGANLLRTMLPNAPILFGGPDCFPLEYGKKYFTSDIFSPDVLLQGEAEDSLPAFLLSYEQHGVVATTVPGFIFKDSDVRLVDTGEPELPRLTSSTVIADYSQIDFSLYHPGGERNGSSNFWTFLSRGCINKCAFCNERHNYKRYRYREPRIVLQELIDACKYARNNSQSVTVVFCDSIFNGNIQKVSELCDLLIESELNVTWRASVSFICKLDGQLLDKMYRSGCRSLFWGFETASDEVIRLMSKNVTMASVKAQLKDTVAACINNDLALITGFPGESPRNVFETIQFIYEYKAVPFISFPYVSVVVAKRNSDLQFQADCYGIVDSNEHSWFTRDRKNTVQTRLLRAFVLEKSLSQSPANFSARIRTIYADFKKLTAMNLNDHAMAAELAGLIYVMGEACDMLPEIISFLGGANSNAGTLESPDLNSESIPADVSLATWTRTNKNSVLFKVKAVLILQRLFRIMQVTYSGRGQ